MPDDDIYEQLAGERLLDPAPRHAHDQAQGQDPATTMLPIRGPVPGRAGPPASDPAPSGFAQADGSFYARPDPTEFDDFDAVDSTTVLDPGAP